MQFQSILEGPEPALPLDTVSVEMDDFIHQCFNQKVDDQSCAKLLLDHPIFSLAKERGVLSSANRALLPTPAKFMPLDFPLAKNIDKAVDAALSWQLQCLEEYKYDAPKSSAKLRYVAFYSPLKIKWLAAQMGIESSILEEK